jgi:hypothetical protein
MDTNVSTSGRPEVAPGARLPEVSGTAATESLEREVRLYRHTAIGSDGRQRRHS